LYVDYVSQKSHLPAHGKVAGGVLVENLDVHPNNFLLQLTGNYKTMKNDEDVATDLVGIFRIRLGIQIIGIARVAGGNKLYTVRCSEPLQAVEAAYDKYNSQNNSRQLKDFLFMELPTVSSNNTATASSNNTATAGFSNTATVGNATVGTATAGVATVGNATVGNATAGTATAGTATAGTATAGVATVGIATAGTATAGVATVGTATVGTATAGVATAGTATVGTATVGTATAGVATAGTATVGNATAGTATAGTATAGVATVGTATVGTATAGVATAGTATVGNATAGTATAGVATAAVGGLTEHFSKLTSPSKQLLMTRLSTLESIVQDHSDVLENHDNMHDRHLANFNELDSHR
jgi:hypothetical protein